MNEKQLLQTQENLRKEHLPEPAVSLKEMMNNLFTDRCKACGYGLKFKDGDFCERCLTVATAKKRLSAYGAEKRIIRLVGEGYSFAINDNIDTEIRIKISNSQYGEDIFIFGPSGTGKTYLTAAMIRHYIYEGFECERINFDDFCVKVRSTMNPASRLTEWELIEPLKKVDKLFIDDLGLRSELETRFTYQTFYSILNKRQECLLPTIICSNKTIAQLGKSFDARIASRLSCALQIEFKGADRRKGRR